MNPDFLYKSSNPGKSDDDGADPPSSDSHAVRTKWPIRGYLISLGVLLSVGCSGSTPPLELSSQDFGKYQEKIAVYHRNEARAMRLRAQEQHVRIGVYERLFGPDSEWVLGARLLAQFYEAAAGDQERQASVHEALGDAQGQPSE